MRSPRRPAMRGLSATLSSNSDHPGWIAASRARRWRYFAAFGSEGPLSHQRVYLSQSVSAGPVDVSVIVADAATGEVLPNLKVALPCATNSCPTYDNFKRLMETQRQAVSVRENFKLPRGANGTQNNVDNRNHSKHNLSRGRRQVTH